MTEKLLTGTLSLKTNKQTNYHEAAHHHRLCNHIKYISYDKKNKLFASLLEFFLKKKKPICLRQEDTVSNGLWTTTCSRSRWSNRSNRSWYSPNCLQTQHHHNIQKGPVFQIYVADPLKHLCITYIIQIIRITEKVIHCLDKIMIWKSLNLLFEPLRQTVIQVTVKIQFCTWNSFLS